MNINQLTTILEGEKPLDNLVSDGGYTCIFPTIVCIGDSLSSGEFEHTDKNGVTTCHDKFEFSWGQFMARTTGNKVYNFSRGGMSCKRYLEIFADQKDLWNKDKRASAYIFALGVNDLFSFPQPVGNINDIDLSDPENCNKETFAGLYGKIIMKYKEIAPDAKFFFVTMPKEDSLDDEKNILRKEHADLLNQLPKLFSNSYVIDLYEYAPLYDAEFKKKFFLGGHMNPAGYKLTAVMIASYIDYIVRSDFEAFKQVGFIGTEYYRKDLE